MHHAVLGLPVQGGPGRLTHLLAQIRAGHEHLADDLRKTVSGRLPCAPTLNRVVPHTVQVLFQVVNRVQIFEKRNHPHRGRQRASVPPLSSQALGADFPVQCDQRLRVCGHADLNPENQARHAVANRQPVDFDQIVHRRVDGELIVGHDDSLVNSGRQGKSAQHVAVTSQHPQTRRFFQQQAQPVQIANQRFPQRLVKLEVELKTRPPIPAQFQHSPLQTVVVLPQRSQGILCQSQAHAEPAEPTHAHVERQHAQVTLLHLTCEVGDLIQQLPKGPVPLLQVLNRVRHVGGHIQFHAQPAGHADQFRQLLHVLQQSRSGQTVPLTRRPRTAVPVPPERKQQRLFFSETKAQVVFRLHQGPQVANQFARLRLGGHRHVFTQKFPHQFARQGVQLALRHGFSRHHTANQPTRLHVHLYGVRLGRVHRPVEKASAEGFPALSQILEPQLGFQQVKQLTRRSLGCAPEQLLHLPLGVQHPAEVAETPGQMRVEKLASVAPAELITESAAQVAKMPLGKLTQSAFDRRPPPVHFGRPSRGRRKPHRPGATQVVLSFLVPQHAVQIDQRSAHFALQAAGRIRPAQRQAKRPVREVKPLSRSRKGGEGNQADPPVRQTRGNPVQRNAPRQPRYLQARVHARPRPHNPQSVRVALFRKLANGFLQRAHPLSQDSVSQQPVAAHTLGLISVEQVSKQNGQVVGSQLLRNRTEAPPQGFIQDFDHGQTRPGKTVGLGQRVHRDQVAQRFARQATAADQVGGDLPGGTRP